MAKPTVFRLAADLPAPAAEEDFLTLYRAPGVTIERIVSDGHVSPPDFWYDQLHDEWVTVIQGGATLAFDDGEVTLYAGDSLLIPTHCRHRVVHTEPATVWLAIHISAAQ